MTLETDIARSQRRIQDLKRRMAELRESSMDTHGERESIALEHSELMNEYLREYTKLIGYRVEYHDKKAFGFRLAAVGVFCMTIMLVVIMLLFNTGAGN
jgi:hypothetical protein